MKIVSAAIKYRLKDDPNTERYVYGPNHAYCIEWFGAADILATMRISEEQGFMTESGDFVDRKTAYEIAEAAGQLIRTRRDKILFSQDVNMTYYHQI